ncbi:MAG: hypothetical protein QGG36_02110 [Pirellulaceae bacterium]|jgi:hypothetical protein|nr:hypothetical protein [Pirellulaceae bacterium]MDP7014574.1 hypothetical protein [Pirellulaceae bacterium]
MHWRLFLLGVLGICCGCGTTKLRTATEQILASDAVDRAVAQIEFDVLAGKRVFLDERHLKAVKTAGFVNSNYIIGSLRQQMFAADVRVVDQLEEADYVVEARIGALGTDEHDITYGVPASSGLSAAASLVPNAPLVPSLPELSLARRSDATGGAKIALFAYERETRRPVWQSGIQTGRSTARATWVLGAGPFQRGTIYDGTEFAGNQIGLPFKNDEESRRRFDAVNRFRDQHVFSQPLQRAAEPVRLSAFEEPAPTSDQKKRE